MSLERYSGCGHLPGNPQQLPSGISKKDAKIFATGSQKSGRISHKIFPGNSEGMLFGAGWGEQDESPVNGKPATIIAWDRLPVEMDQSTTEGG